MKKKEKEKEKKEKKNFGASLGKIKLETRPQILTERKTRKKERKQFQTIFVVYAGKIKKKTNYFFKNT